jgi:hypothetical protein
MNCRGKHPPENAGVGIQDSEVYQLRQRKMKNAKETRALINQEPRILQHNKALDNQSTRNTQRGRQLGKTILRSSSTHRKEGN